MEPIGALAVVATLAIICMKAVEQLRRFFPTLEDGWVILTAWVVGFVLAIVTGTAATADLFESWGLTLAIDPPLMLDYAITGIIVAASAGAFADFLGRSGSDESSEVVATE